MVARSEALDRRFRDDTEYVECVNLLATSSSPHLNHLISQDPDQATEERRVAALLRHAPIEFARVVYGLSDHANGRLGTAAAQEVARTARNGAPVTRERAEQRARGYLPTAGHAHCPRCWVFAGIKSPLHFRASSDDRPETAVCKVCGAEYAT